MAAAGLPCCLVWRHQGPPVPGRHAHPCPHSSRVSRYGYPFLRVCQLTDPSVLIVSSPEIAAECLAALGFPRKILRLWTSMTDQLTRYLTWQGSVHPAPLTNRNGIPHLAINGIMVAWSLVVQQVPGVRPGLYIGVPLARCVRFTKQLFRAMALLNSGRMAQPLTAPILSVRLQPMRLSMPADAREVRGAFANNYVAEIAAIVMAVHCAVSSVCVYTDCNAAVQVWQSMRMSQTVPSHAAAADLWTLFWEIVRHKQAAYQAFSVELQ